MTDSTRFTDEQLDRMVGELKHFGGGTTDPAFGEYAIMANAAEAIRQLRERVSLLEGERNEARQMAQVNFLDLSAEKQARLKAESEVIEPEEGTGEAGFDVFMEPPPLKETIIQPRAAQPSVSASVAEFEKLLDDFELEVREHQKWRDGLTAHVTEVPAFRDALVAFVRAALTGSPREEEQ
jgi:hypothetical protein